MSHLSTALRFLIRRKLVELDGDPAEVLKPFKVMRKVPVALTKPQIQALWNTGHEPARALLLLGCRKSELLALKPEDVRESGILIRGEKTHVERLVPHEILGAPITPPFEWNREAWSAAKEAAGSPWLKPKDCRSTAARYISSSGKVPPMIAAAILGHSLNVLQSRYFVPIYGLTGDTLFQWYGLQPTPTSVQ
jgi:integrase